MVRKSSKWSSWQYVNQSSDHSLLYQRLRCVCRAHTSDASTLRRPQIRTQLRHYPVNTITSSSSSSSCPSATTSSIGPPTPPQLKPRSNKPTAISHNEVLSDASVDRWTNHRHHLEQYCNCRDLGSLRVCRRCPSTTGFTKYHTRTRRYVLSPLLQSTGDNSHTLHRIN